MSSCRAHDRQKGLSRRPIRWRYPYIYISHNELQKSHFRKVAPLPYDFKYTSLCLVHTVSYYSALSTYVKLVSHLNKSWSASGLKANAGNLVALIPDIP